MSKKNSKRKTDPIYQLLIEAHSKAICEKIIRRVGNDKEKFDVLINYFLGKDEELARRAGWPMSFIVQMHPELVIKWFPKLIRNLDRPNQHPAIYRNTFRFLQEIKIPEKFSAPILDAAYKYVLNASHPPAVRAFALTTAWNVVSKYPELAAELLMVAEQVIKEDSKAMKSRGKRTLSDIERLKNM